MTFNYLVIFCIIFSCTQNLHAMVARTCRTVAQTTYKKVCTRALPVSLGLKTFQSGFPKKLHINTHSGWYREIKQPKQEKSMPMSDDTDMKSSETSGKSSQEKGLRFLTIIQETGMKYEGEVAALLEYVHGLNNDSRERFNNYIFELVVKKIEHVNYVHPILVSFVVLTQKDGFAKIIESMVKNIKQISNATVFASYKPLELLLQYSRTQIGYRPFKKWICVLPLEEFGDTLTKYFSQIPQNISPTCEENLVQLMYGVSVLLEALLAHDATRHVEIATLKKDAERYQNELDMLRLAHDPHALWGEA